MESNTEYPFSGYIEINDTDVFIKGTGWFSDGGNFEYQIEDGQLSSLNDDVFELFQICNKPKKLPECFLNNIV